MFLELAADQRLSPMGGRWISLLVAALISVGLVWVMMRLASPLTMPEPPIRLISDYIAPSAPLQSPVQPSPKQQMHKNTRAVGQHAEQPTQGSEALTLIGSLRSDMKRLWQNKGLASKVNGDGDNKSLPNLRQLLAHPPPLSSPLTEEAQQAAPLSAPILHDLARMAEVRPLADLISREGFQRLESRHFAQADKMNIAYDDVTQMEVLIWLRQNGNVDVAWCNVLWTSAPSSLAQDIAQDTVKQIKAWRLPLSQADRSKWKGRSLLLYVRREAGKEPRLTDIRLVAG